MTQSRDQFATTQWTLVWRAAREDSQAGRPALEQVIRNYWQPLYAFARRRGLSSEDAEDATQEFLSRILTGNLLETADPAKGKFRAYLLTAWKRFLIDQLRRDRRLQRGGGLRQLSIQAEDGELNWRVLSTRSDDPDRTFMLSWARTLLERTREELLNEYAKSDRRALAESLLPWLTQSLELETAEELARSLGLSVGALKVALHRLRKRYGQTLRKSVAETVDDPAEVDAELSELLQILSES